MCQGLEEALQGIIPTNGVQLATGPSGWRISLGKSWLILPLEQIQGLQEHTAARHRGHVFRMLPFALMGLFVMAREDYEAERAFGGRALLTHAVDDFQTGTRKGDKLRRLAQVMGLNPKNEDQLKTLNLCLYLLKAMHYGYTIGKKVYVVEGFFSYEDNLTYCNSIEGRRAGTYQVIQINPTLFHSSLKHFVRMPLKILQSGDVRLVLATLAVLAEKSYKKEAKELSYDAFYTLRDSCTYQPRRRGFKRDVMTYLKPQLDKLVELGILVSYAFKQGIELCFAPRKPQTRRKPPKDSSPPGPSVTPASLGLPAEVWDALKRTLYEEVKALLPSVKEESPALKFEPG